MEIISGDLLWGARREAAEKPQQEQLDSRPRFESSTFQIEAYGDTAPRTFSTRVEQRVTEYEIQQILWATPLIVTPSRLQLRW
jgi:hypothetical protein